MQQWRPVQASVAVAAAVVEEQQRQKQQRQRPGPFEEQQCLGPVVEPGMPRQQGRRMLPWLAREQYSEQGACAGDLVASESRFEIAAEHQGHWKPAE